MRKREKLYGMETSPPTPPKSPAKPMIMRIYVWWSTRAELHLTPPEVLPLFISLCYTPLVLNLRYGQDRTLQNSIRITMQKHNAKTPASADVHAK